MDEIKKSNAILKNIMSRSVALDLRIDTIGLPYALFRDRFAWPSVHSMNPLPEEKLRITEILSERLPEFVSGCSLIPETRPHRDISRVQYVREYRVEDQSFLYILNVSADYLGGARREDILSPGSQGISPSFLTDRIYFSARLVPAREIHYDAGAIVDFEPLKIREARFKVEFTETIRDVWSTILFDEIDYTEINRSLSDRFAFDAEWRLGKLALPFVIDHMTICLNLIHPGERAVGALLIPFSKIFRSVIGSGDLSDLNEEERRTLARFYTEWEYARFLSNSENTHWKITKTPFAELAEQSAS
jgi:hypothetical protein